MKNISALSLLIFLLSLLLLVGSLAFYFFGNIGIFLPIVIISFFLFSLFLLSVYLQIKTYNKLKKIAESFSINVPENYSLGSLIKLLDKELNLIRELVIEKIPEAVLKEFESKEINQKIYNLISRHIKTNAIEIKLFEEISGVSAKNYILGCPEYINQSSEEESEYIITIQLIFSKRNFGKINIEVQDVKDKSFINKKILELISTYCSLLYINAEFHNEILRIQKFSEDSNHGKTGFLATLSHEIRGPLGVIMNSIELVLDGLCGDVTIEVRDTLKMVQDSSKHLMDLVNDVLDYARIESGIIDTSPIAISVNDLMSDMAAVVRSQAIQKNINIKVEKTEDIIGLFSDKRHTRQIMLNFLTNAIKYTKDGGKINLSATLLGSERVKIMVEDSGIGIPEHELHKVFGLFQRVDNEYSNIQKGTGLGMPLTKKLAEANNGCVGFSSEVEKGSIFWVELPFSIISKLELEDEEGQIVSFGNGEKVLLVEPDSDQAEMYKKSLIQRGFSVNLVNTASEILRELKSSKYSAIILETDLPDLGGEELIKTIRSTPSGSKVPLIVISGKAFVFDLEHFIRLGVDRCLSKPFSLSELSFTVKKIIDETISLEKAADIM